MLQSRLFWKLFLTFGGLNLFAAVLLVALAHRWQRDRAFVTAQAELREIALLVREDARRELDAAANDALADRIVRLAQVSGKRITLIALDGTVLVDSTADPGAASPALENQKRRPEVVAALARGSASERRISLLFDEPALYFALRVGTGEAPLGVVRTSLQVSEVNAEVAAFDRLLMLVAAAIALGAVLVTYLVIRRLVTPLLTLTAAAQAIAKGDYGQTVFVPGSDELSQLAESLNQVSDELGTQLSQLRASDERKSAVLGGMAEGVVAVDGRERVLFANPAAGKQFGFLPPSVVGRPLLEVIRDHDLHQAVAQVLSTRQPVSLEIQWETDASRILAVEITALRGALGAGAVMVLHDNTELRRLETIRQEFIANVSHELKTPLSSIMAYTETLQRGAMDDRENRERFLSRIAEQGERLHNLIQDMLSLARIETAQQPFEIVRVPVAEVVAHCLEDHRPQAEAKSIVLSTAAPLSNESASAASAEFVRADEEGLRVMLNNLIDNAIKYTPDSGRVEVSWRRAEEDIRIDVTDTGPGIPRAELPRVFERFYRIDKARSRELGSTGLGLSIVKHLAQSFGGKVGVESEVGKGSRFWVRLPAAS